MKINIASILRRGANALIATVLISAAIHLAASFLFTAVTRDVDYINPIEFLGFSAVLPQYVHSLAATAIAWGVLIAIFFVLFYFHAYLLVALNPSRKRLPKYLFKVGDELIDTLRLQAEQRARLKFSKHKSERL